MSDLSIAQKSTNGHIKSESEELRAQLLAELDSGGHKAVYDWLLPQLRLEGHLPPTPVGDGSKRKYHYTENELSVLPNVRWLYEAEGIRIPAQSFVVLAGPSGKG